MRKASTLKTHVFKIIAALAAALLPGCGGTSGSGGGKSEAEHEISLGSVVTRVVGTAQPPVTASGFGAVVTGVSGATVTSLMVNDSGAAVETSKIAFVAGNSTVRDVYVMGSDGASVKNLTNNTKGTSVGLSWSPDGKRIAFDSSRDGASHIFVMNVDGTGITALTRESDFSPAWSPDGKQIAFHSSRIQSSNVFVMNTNGSGQTPLPVKTSDSRVLAWSPDSRQISFSDTRDSGDIPQIYSMSVTGGSVMRVRPDLDTQIESDPAWSPDGSRIAFVRRSQSTSDVFLMNPDGTGLVNLTNTPAAPKTSPTWSPDGRKVAFVSKGDIYVINAGGGPINRLTLLGNVVAASWGPPAHAIPLIGTGAPFSTAAAGFLFATSGTTVSSVVAFDATTRSAARVSPQTGQSSTAPNIVFNIDAGDSLTRLQYMNNLGAAPTVVIGPGAPAASATSALVSFSSATGKVAFVLPFVANRAAIAAAPRKEGGELVYHGSFLGVWDEKGTNVAPSGASEVRVNVCTGQLASRR